MLALLGELWVLFLTPDIMEAQHTVAHLKNYSFIRGHIG